jgi:hypothetical protein
MLGRTLWLGNSRTRRNSEDTASSLRIPQLSSQLICADTPSIQVEGECDHPRKFQYFSFMSTLKKLRFGEELILHIE